MPCLDVLSIKSLFTHVRAVQLRALFHIKNSHSIWRMHWPALQLSHHQKPMVLAGSAEADDIISLRNQMLE
jgi:hypothetical protein